VCVFIVIKTKAMWKAEAHVLTSQGDKAVRTEERTHSGGKKKKLRGSGEGRRKKLPKNSEEY